MKSNKYFTVKTSKPMFTTLMFGKFEAGYNCRHLHRTVNTRFVLFLKMNSYFPDYPI